MSSFSVPIYQKRLGSSITLTTLGLGAATQSRTATSVPKAEEQLRDVLRKAIEAARPATLGQWDLIRGTRLERVRLELTLKDDKRRKITGLCPIIVEPRTAGDGKVLHVAYHPERQTEWFPVTPFEPIADAATSYFAQAWSTLPDSVLATLWTNTKDSLKVLSFDAQERTLLQDLPGRKRGVWEDLEIDPNRQDGKKPTGLRLLPQLATNLTASGSFELGLPRSPYREQLRVLFAGGRRQSVIVVGRSGSGKTTILQQLVRDLVTDDGYASHRNIDRVRQVWRLTGKQLIAGMSRVGQWEQRCVELLDDVRGRRLVILAPDVHLFGRIGRARDSERALADFFRGPVARGEIVLLGECTPEQLRELEEDDPAFAAAFTRVHVAPATRDETFRMMLARARAIEVASPEATPTTIEPLAFETILQMSEGLFPAHALPGKAIDLLGRLASAGGSIGPAQVIARLSNDTGLPWVLLTPERPLPVSEVAAELGERVIGQEVAVAEAADLVVRIRTGLTDPKRPFGVFLFTGPTGTGKTELAKALADYLYGSPARLLRFDMSEYAGPDAVARLIGDAWAPEGQLTAAALAEPFSVVLLDEIEKAHPAVLNLLLQLFDDGRLTDAAGTTASFTQSVVVMTSNLGARQRPPVGFGESADAILADVARAVREFFPPELFNRIDAIVPFKPLTPEVAIRVTEKELGKLFRRSGLVERNAFVQIGRATVERIARTALRTEDGARSVKRFIEDRIGTLLGEQIAKTPGAALQVLRIVEDPREDGADDGPGPLRVESDALVEAAPAAVRYGLEPLWTRPLGELREKLPETLAALERIEKSDRLLALCETLRHHLGELNRGRREHGELLYNIEWMRLTLERLRERIEGLVVASQDLAHHALETAILQRDVWEARKKPWKPDPRPLPGRMRFDFGHTGSWWELFSTIAETFAIERALDKVTTPEQHAVFVELLPIGAADTGRTFLAEMTRAYQRARGEVDAVAWLVRETGEDAPRVHSGEGRAAIDAMFGEGRKPDLVVMKMVGLCIKDYLELETGTHIWQPSIREPELVRVRVLPAPAGVGPESHVKEYVAAKARAESDADAAAPHPDRLLPIARTIRFDPPPPRKAAALLEMEDYVLGMPYTTRVTTIADAFATLWLLRLSRVEVRPDAETEGGQ